MGNLPGSMQSYTVLSQEIKNEVVNGSTYLALCRLESNLSLKTLASVLWNVHVSICCSVTCRHY